MVLSDTGDHRMTKLSDTQLVILSAATQREDGAVLPLTIDLKGGAVQKVLASLERNELIARMGKPRGDDPPPLCITRPGLDALGIAPEDPEAPDPALGGAALRRGHRGSTARHQGAGAGAGEPADRRFRDRPCGQEARATREHQAGKDDRAAQAARRAPRSSRSPRPPDGSTTPSGVRSAGPSRRSSG
jgi:hypothetical protein